MKKHITSGRGISSYIVIIPAYNEESSIEAALDAVYTAAQNVPQKLRRVIVCLNGCTDKTEAIVRKQDGLPITIIKSPSGYIHAMNRLIGHALRYYPDDMVVKTDADGQLDPMAFTYLFGQLTKHPEVIMAGGHPIPRPSPYLPIQKRIIGSILSVRGRYPLAEVSAGDAHKFHPYADTDPMPGVGSVEKRLKIYFHGRLWCARSISHICKLDADVLGDDVYLAAWLFKKYGHKCIRLDYRANVYFRPNDSLKRHWKVYRRIYEDRQRVFAMPEFHGYAKACPTKLDWKYIATHVPANEFFNFVAYAAIVCLENITFALTEYRDVYWQYQEKEA